MKNKNRKVIKVILFITFILVIGGTLKYTSYKEGAVLSPYPDGKNFAFTITDDPDWNTTEKISPIYDLLSKLGFKTTIAVWVKYATHTQGLPDKDGLFDYGDTCQK